MTEFRRATCNGCGKPIVWATTAEGKRIPLDPRPAVYRVVEDPQRPKNYSATRIEEVSSEGRPMGAMVTHFATCPKAGDFSGSRKPKPD